MTVLAQLADGRQLEFPDGTDPDVVQRTVKNVLGAGAANDSAPPRTANGVWDDLIAGYQTSATGLLARGRLPDIVLDPATSKWYDRALEGIGSTISDLPEMTAGGWLGGHAGPTAGWALANAVPAEIRASLMKAYQNGDATSSADFLSRVGIVIKGLGDADVLKATGKAAAVGALTAGAGQVAGKVVGPLLGDAVTGGLSPTLARVGYDVAKTGAEVGTMAVAPAALEGRLPEPRDFADAAIVVGGLKLASGIAGKMADLYARGGIPPEQVVADAKADPSIADDLKYQGAKVVEEKTGGNHYLSAISQSEDGYVSGMVEDGAVRITHSSLPDAERGQGKGVGMYEALINDAHSRGLRVLSDDVVSADAQRVYAALERRGYIVERNGDAVTKDDGALMVPRGGAVFEVKPPENGLPDSEIPAAYKPAIAATTAREVIPDPKADPNHALDLAAMLQNPYGTIPEAKLPNFENFKYVQGPEDMQAVSARASEIFTQQIEAARGTQTWEQTKQGAIEFLAKRAADLGDAFSMPATDDAVVKLAARGMAAESMQQAASRALAAAADKINREGATPENVNAQIGAIEMVRAWTALDQGNGAEIARALNARKAALQMRLLSEDLFEGMNRYGDDPEAMAKFIASLGDPQKIGRFARQIEPATTMEKALQYYRFSLLSGATVFQVKAIGDLSATLERLVNAAVRVPIGALHGEGMDRLAELSAMAGQIGQGVKDGMSAMVDTWKALQQPRAVFGEPGSPNLVDRITQLPGRIIESETELFRVLNERMEMGRQAAMLARGDGFVPGAGDYAQRITTLLQSPTKAMQEASMAAGREATFTNPTSGLGKLLQQISNGATPVGKAGGFILPFARVPVNIAAWTIKDTPLLGLLMKGNREAWAEGGAARDGVIARQVIGGTVALLAAGAVSGGRMTGGGLSMTPEEHAGRKASIPDYSFKFGNTWYSYERFQPLGAIAGLVADLMEMHQKADTQYQPDIAKLTGAVMGHAIISQPYFEGINDLMGALTSPTGEGAKQFDRFTASWIPSFLAQAASASDPYKREVQDLFDTIQARIPIWRNQLQPQINPLTGQPVANAAAPVRGAGLVQTMDASNDPVLNEAARLRVGVARTPKSVEMPTSLDRDRTLGKIDLTPEQQEVFSSTAGRVAHEMMMPIVNSPRWETMPDLVKKRIFSNVLAAAHKLGEQAALPAAQRAAKMQEIADEITAKLGQLKAIQ